MANELVNVGGVWTLREAEAGGTPRVLPYRKDVGGTPPTPGSGVLGQSMSFNGSSDRFDHSSHRSMYDFTQVSDFSVAGWLKTTTTTAHVLAHVFTPAPGYSYPFGWSLRIVSGELYLKFDGGSTSYKMTATSTDSINNGAWRHVAVTYNGTGASPGSPTMVKFYIDGTHSPTVNGYTLTSSHSMQNAYPLLLGSDSRGTSLFTGDMDDMALWNVVLTPTQITDLYNSGSGNLASTEPTGLVAHWKCDTVALVNAGGGIYRWAAPDASGNGLDMHYQG